MEKAFRLMLTSGKIKLQHILRRQHSHIHVVYGTQGLKSQHINLPKTQLKDKLIAV